MNHHRPSLARALRGLVWGATLLSACGGPAAPGPRVAEHRGALGTPCVTPQEMTGAEDLNYTTDGFPSVRFRPPSTAYGGSQTTADTFLAAAKPAIITSLPFDSADGVSLVAGWLYDSGDSHRGLDFALSSPQGADATFPVRAMADGVVRKIVPLNPNSPNGGNVIIIEHPIPGQPSVFSLYMHLRNGKTADQAAVQSIAAACPGYALWAKNNPNDPSWGTDSQRILVNQGDTVSRGQQIAWAGNTGCGAAGRVIDASGNTSSPTVNTHLHVYFAAEDPSLAFVDNGGNPVRVAVMIDPFGVYEKASTSCYDSPTEVVSFPRHIMPFYPDFHNVPLQWLTNHFDYYPGMGLAMQTVSLSQSGDTVYAMGSFQPGLSPYWQAALWYSPDGFDSLVSSYQGQGMRPRQVTVALDGKGNPHYSALFTPLLPGETATLYKDLSPLTFDALYQTLGVRQGYRVDDYFEYQIGGQPAISAIFTTDYGAGFQLFRELSHQTEQALILSMQVQGWQPMDLNVADQTWTRALIFRPDGNCWIAQSGMSSAGYQKFHDDVMGARGYRLYQVQTYDSNSTFAAIATQPAVHGPCP